MTNIVLTETPEVIPGELSDTKVWEKAVVERCRAKCGNCGSDERLRVKMIVPQEAGGQMVPSNGVLLCRSCEMAADAAARPGKGENRRLVNFWVSRGLCERLKQSLGVQKGFHSMGGLVRYLMAKYVEDESRFQDLELYQDEGTDTKINVWVDRDRYDTFKALLDKRGVTVTESIKSLILMFLDVGGEKLGEQARPSNIES